MKSELNNLYQELDLNPKNNFGINIVYHILNPIFSSYFNLGIINPDNIKKEISPILYISRHYDEIDILCQQKASKEIRDSYPSYLVKKDLAFLDKLSFGIVPFYRGRDLDSSNIKNLKYNERIINELIPSILGNGEDFLIYPEGTRRKGRKFKVLNKVLEDIVSIHKNTVKNFDIIPNIVSVDYRRDNRDILMKFGELLKEKELNKIKLKEYLYSTITY